MSQKSPQTFGLNPALRVRSPGMLAFDIETTGLDPKLCQVTCVCTQDYHTNATKVYEFARTQHENPEDFQDLVTELGRCLDSAESLCAFNGVRFDIPFLQVALGYAPDRAAAWTMKTSDILEQCRLLRGCTFSLNLLCEANGVQVKSSSGLEAVHMAKRCEWRRLREYCACDVQILCDLYRKRHIVNPRTREIMDLALMAHPALYLSPAAPAEAAPAEAAAPHEPSSSHTIRHTLSVLKQKLAETAKIADALQSLLD